MKLQFSFLPIPEELMKSKAISWGAKYLFGIIAKANREKLRWSIRYLAERMGCKAREAQKRVAELRKNNLIIVKGRDGRVNEYTINLEMIQIVQEKEDPPPEMNEREKIAWELFKKQKGKCSYCGIEMIWVDKFKHYSWEESLRWCEIDHIKPKAKGGKDEISNYTLACSKCNREKGVSIWTSPKRTSLSTQSERPYSKELSTKNPLKGSNKVAIIRNYFTERCKELKGFEPEMAFGKEGQLLKEKLKRYSEKELKDLIDKFMRSRVGEDLGITLSICLSAGVINQWLGGKLERPKKPTYQGKPMRKMYGKWQVLEKGEWLEFADAESKIIYV